LPDPAMASPFPDRLRGVPPVAVQLSLTRAVDPAVRFAFPPECRARPARGPLPAPLDATSLERLPWGFRPLRDTNRQRPLPVLRRGPRAHTQARFGSVLGVSHALDGLLRCRPRGFISPRSHVRDSSSGVFPRAQPYGLSTAVALWSLAPRSCCRLPDSASPLRPPSRAFLRARVRLRRMTV